MKSIEFSTPKGTYNIANSWNELTPDAYLALIADILQYADGKLSPAMVKVRYVCRALGINIRKIKNEDALANITWLAEQVTFPFIIVYPNDDEAIKRSDKEQYNLFKRVPPEKIDNPMARYLSRLEYKFAVDSIFCAQLLPTIKIPCRPMRRCKEYKSYTIDTAHGILTSSMTALQWVEARQMSDGSRDKLALLAAMLYCPAPYSSEKAQRLADDFAKLPDATLQAIAFNFNAFNNYLFTATDFSILAEGKESKRSISTGPEASLYNLSADGLGSNEEIEKMSVIKYFTILRKKLIESVRSLSSAGMKISDIEKETGLPLPIISKIL